jgi:hypothetical protein
MEEQYKRLHPGVLYQVNRTGPSPDYSTAEYSTVRYDQYQTVDAMSKLRYDLIKRHIPEFETICDFGYGNGAFIKDCQTQGHTCFAYDISTYPLPNTITKVDNVDEHELDVLTFFDSIEHVEDENLLQFLNNKKAKYFVISVPWYHALLSQQWFEDWKHRRPNEHLHHFDAIGLCRLLDMANCDILHVGNDEDAIRKSTGYWPNILTVVAKRR